MGGSLVLRNHRISLQRTDNKRNISNVNMSRIKSSDKYLSSSIVKEIKLLGTAEEEMMKHPKISSIATHSVKKEKSGVHHQPLKEKKGSELDLFASNALREILESLKGSDMVLLASSNSKCTFESPRERNPSHISPTLGKEGQGSEIIGGFENNMYPDHHSSLLEDNVNGKIMTLGVSVTIENDENMEKAEAYGKEIENIQIRAMLRKKHEEAKELLVRALVNSNSLLMLDNPAYEEQILQLQNFVADLLLKK